MSRADPMSDRPSYQCCEHCLTPMNMGHAIPCCEPGCFIGRQICDTADPADIQPARERVDGGTS